MSALHDLTAVGQAQMVRRGEVSPTELVDHYLKRIDAWNSRLGAYVVLSEEVAHAQASAAEALVVEANRAGEIDDLPPLLGVPIAVKDLNNVAGVPTRMGSSVVDMTPDHDDHVVTKLRQAGLCFLGKTNTPEFGLPCYTESAIAPAARTPWDVARSAGGSSGGAAAAVAGGLAALAQGSDGGGSIRIPASVCGLVGIKPSRGRISNGPLGNAPGDLAVQGPLARTVADAAALLDAMSGDVVGDPFPGPPLPQGGFLRATETPPVRLRIGRYRNPVLADTDVAPECLEGWQHATDLLVGLGHDLVDIDRPFGPEVVGHFENVWSALTTLAPIAPEDESRLMPLTRWLRARGSQLSAADLAHSLAFLRALSRSAIQGTADYDAVLTPTLARLPVLVGGMRDDNDPVADFEAQKHFTPFTSPYNVTGQPAISIPLEWTDAGLPVGVQLVGRPGGEAALIALSAQLEAAAPWVHRKPDCWAMP